MNSGKKAGGILRLGLLAVLAMFVMQNCASGRKGSGDKLKSRDADYLMSELALRQMEPEWMSARARIKYDDGYMNVGGTANILLRKDSLVWVSVRKLGFEVARAMITPDSVYVIDRLNNEYLVEGLEYLAKEYKVPADFEALQAIFLGNPVFFARRGFRVSNEEGMYHLQGSDGKTVSQYWLDGRNLSLRRMAFDDHREARKLNISLKDYQDADPRHRFSFLRELEMDSADTGALSVEIAFSDVEFNVPKSVRFDIPPRYTRTD